MTTLIQRLRRLVGESEATGTADGSCAALTDDEALQESLDNRRTEARYVLLKGIESVAPGGVVTFLDWDSIGIGDWEDDVKLYGANFSPLTPLRSDPQRGRWTFAAHQQVVRVTGSYYDLYGAAADVLEAMAARLKAEIDFSTSDMSYRLSQQSAQYLAMAATYRCRQKPSTAKLMRTDTPCGPYAAIGFGGGFGFDTACGGGRFGGHL